MKQKDYLLTVSVCALGVSAGGGYAAGSSLCCGPGVHQEMISAAALSPDYSPVLPPAPAASSSSSSCWVGAADAGASLLRMPPAAVVEPDVKSEQVGQASHTPLVVLTSVREYVFYVFFQI